MRVTAIAFLIFFVLGGISSYPVDHDFTGEKVIYQNRTQKDEDQIVFPSNIEETTKRELDVSGVREKSVEENTGIDLSGFVISGTKQRFAGIESGYDSQSELESRLGAFKKSKTNVERNILSKNITDNLRKNTHMADMFEESTEMGIYSQFELERLKESKLIEEKSKRNNVDSAAVLQDRLHLNLGKIEIPTDETTQFFDEDSEYSTVQTEIMVDFRISSAALSSLSG
ncbi:hypothetical protein HHI36_006388 [Cryptolaemus montrouzieri]|uniref:Secreted protein n=1 Tax=Cryptolaemus montrouzieri TaxID=559131 RepID=A0ABD2NX80_9CUCU